MTKLETPFEAPVVDRLSVRVLVEPLVSDRINLVTIDGADHFFLDFFIEDAADAAVAAIGE